MSKHNPPGPAGRETRPPWGSRTARALLTAALTLTGSAVVLASTGTPALANEYYNSLHEASPGNVRWMREVPGNLSIAALSVPGTHDTLSLCGDKEPLGCDPATTNPTKTQQDFGFGAPTLRQQLTSGIRALDIRVRVNKDPVEGMTFTIHHGPYYQDANFADVLATVRDFLQAQPTESVFLNLKAECTSESLSCKDAADYATDEWRLRILRGYLDGEAFTGKDTSDSRPATRWGDYFYAPSVTGTSQAATPTLDAVRGKIVLMGYRGTHGGIFGGYGLSQLYPAAPLPDRYPEYVQDADKVPTIADIADKWEKVRAHLRKTNGVADATRAGEPGYGWQPDAIYLNYTSGSSAGAYPYTVAGGTPTANGVNEFLIQCLHNTDGRCPEFYPKRPGNFSGCEKMNRTGILMMDFPGGRLVDDIIARNLDTNGTTSCPTPTPTAPPVNPYKDAVTFAVKGSSSGRSFTTTQPRNSVATYTWTDDGQAPQEWLTSASGSNLDRRMEKTAVAAYGSPTETVVVDENRTYQTIDGFGGAMTDSAAALILGSAHRDTALQQLFGTGSGQAGLTMVRSPMGSSDLMADGNDFHTYEDTRGSFSVEATASDKRQIDALTRAKAITGGDFKLIGTPWSAPGWAKRGQTLRPKGCGIEANELDARQVGAYADYFGKYVEAYTAKDLKPWMVSLQNEPQNCKTAMPTTLIPSGTAVSLARSVKSRIPGDVKVLGWDHNWNDKAYVDALTAAGSVDAVGYHCYDGTHYANQTTAVATYMTECSGFTDSTANVEQNLGWEVANMLMGPLRHGSKGSIYWSLAQDRSGDPHLDSPDACQTCRGMLTRNADGTFEPSQDYYFFAQFSAFVRPGALRIESTNSGDVSTVAFRHGATTTMVVLVSGHHADGGSAGSDERDLRRHIVQYNGENAPQKTAWLVGADGYRRWISDGSTFNCLTYDAGMQGPDNVAGGALDKYINLENVWAVCGAYTMGARSQLEVGTYIKSGGNARLTLTAEGLRVVDSAGATRWAPPGRGDRLVLQEDNNLVLYSGSQAVWASGTMGSGAAWLSIRDDGTFILSDKANKKVWVSPAGTRDYRGRIVQYDGDTSAQKTAWLVGNDGVRRWIPDLPTFQCLQGAGHGTPLSLSSDVLDTVRNLDGVWAACGTDRIGPNGAVEARDHLKAGDYRLTLSATELVLTRNGTRVWAPGAGGEQLKLQTDGNLVMYDRNGTATWSTRTFGKSAGWLVLGTDGSLRLYDAAGKQVWSR